MVLEKYYGLMDPYTKGILLMIEGIKKEGLFENNIYRGNGQSKLNNFERQDFVIEEDFDGEMNESMMMSRGAFNYNQA